MTHPLLFVVVGVLLIGCYLDNVTCVNRKKSKSKRWDASRVTTTLSTSSNANETLQTLPWAPPCHEWNWKDRKRNALPEEEQVQIREPVGDPTIFKAANIVRIDRGTFDLKTDGKPQLDHAQFHWAWHSGSCNGLKDQKWVASDGMALFMNMKEDALRLKTLEYCRK